MSSKKEIVKSEELVKKVFRKKKMFVRTSFNLSTYAHNVIKESSEYFNLKNAEFLELTTNNFDAAAKGELDKWVSAKKEGDKKFRKTYLVEKNTLTKLEEVAEKYKIARDLILEKTVLVIKGIVDKHKESIKEAFKYAIDGGGGDVQIGLDGALQGVEEVEDYLEEYFSDDDPILVRLDKIVSELKDLIEAMRKYIDEGKPIE